MPWIVYIADEGQEREEIARAATREHAEVFGAIARELAERDGLAREVTVTWQDEPPEPTADRSLLSSRMLDTAAPPPR